VIVSPTLKGAPHGEEKSQEKRQKKEVVSEYPGNGIDHAADSPGSRAVPQASETRATRRQLTRRALPFQ
jgi:hypothetical protein